MKTVQPNVFLLFVLCLAPIGCLVCIGTCRWKEKYDNASDFKNGFAKVAFGKGVEAKIGYVDKTGKVIWQPSNKIQSPHPTGYVCGNG